MKVVILCGGRGTRLSEHGSLVPKVLTPIGGEPIVVHLMRHYADYGVTDFVLCLGYLKEQIEEYFVDAEVKFPSWSVTLVDTGLDTPTGGRVKAVEQLVRGEGTFMITYGDGLADVDVSALLDDHRSHGRSATLTAVRPVSNFGLIDIDAQGHVTTFREKPVLKEWVNGGFFVVEPNIFELLAGDSVLESDALTELAARGELMAFRHEGFWKCMDTHKDRMEFEELFVSSPPWIK
jgi:glucose-1-phosphate cytidylyltransferase